MGTGEYIPMYANRDLTDYDIENYMARDGMTERELIDMLCSRGLYKPVQTKSSKPAIKKEMAEIAKKTEVEEKESDNGNSTDST
jgi:hypothetical protein